MSGYAGTLGGHDPLQLNLSPIDRTGAYEWVETILCDLCISSPRRSDLADIPSQPQDAAPGRLICFDSTVMVVDVALLARFQYLRKNLSRSGKTSLTCTSLHGMHQAILRGLCSFCIIVDNVGVYWTIIII